MGNRKYATFGEEIKARICEDMDAEARQAERFPPSGADLRRRIDVLGFSYVQVARWLGLSADGLHKQMRGDRAVSAQTVLLFNRIEERMKGLDAFTAAELRVPYIPGQNPKAFQAALLKAAREERAKRGLGPTKPIRPYRHPAPARSAAR